MQVSRFISLSPSSSPSFSCYSSVNVAEIAARVVEEIQIQESQSQPNSTSQILQNDVVTGSCEDDDFEFAFTCREPESSPLTPADEIFQNGLIRPVHPYPLFDTNLLRNDSNGGDSTKPTKKSKRSPLKKLMSEDRETAVTNDLYTISPETYCIWTPKKPDGDGSRQPEQSPTNRKKSSSTGSSKRWKLRDLLYAKTDSDEKYNESVDEEDKTALTKEQPSSTVDENCKLFVRNSSKATAKEADLQKRRSYLPLKQDLVGLLSNFNGLSRNLHPF